MQEHVAKLNEMNDHAQTAKIKARTQEHVAKLNEVSDRTQAES